MLGCVLVHTPTEGSTMQRCVEHIECADGSFCGVAVADSYEGWLYNASFCRPCSQCGCHDDSSDGRCPADRCPGAPFRMLRHLEGTFVSATSFAKYGGDLCVTSLTVRSHFFRMVSFRVRKETFDLSSASALGYSVTNTTGPTLCDFPDAPGSREGRIRTEPVTSPDMVANLVLTYMDGLPMGTTRVVQLFDRCPLGFSASFGPIQIVKTGFVEEIGMETPFYEYVSGQEGQPRANLPSSGTDDLGKVDAIMCNITFSFDRGHEGISPWDQSIWGCRLRTPYTASSRYAGGQNHMPTHMHVDQTQTPNPSETSRSKSYASHESALMEGDRPTRDLLARETCSPGFHQIYETTTEGQAEMLEKGEIPPSRNDPEWSCILNPRYCCEACAMGKYQHESSKFLCLSCPHGFTNNKNGSAALEECCIPVDGIGLYNGGDKTFYNEFGINGSEHKIYAAYYVCQGRDTFNVEDKDDMDSGLNHRYDLAGCGVKEEHISTIPNVTDDVLKDFNLGSPGPICDDVHFTIQPMVGGASVASFIELDYGCPNCFFDLGPQGSLNVSFFLVSDGTVRPPELTFKMTEPPGVSRPRDTQLKTFESRKWKGIQQSPALDYSLDLDFPIDQFRGSDTPFTRHYAKMKCGANVSDPQFDSSIENCSAIPVTPVSTEIVIGKMLSGFNSAHEEQQARFACEYEDPVIPGQLLVHPWQGKALPRCEEEYSTRLRILNDSLFNDHTPYRQHAPRMDPLRLGVRIHARITPGHAGFTLGYRFAQSSDVCRAGSFSYNGVGPCDLCPAGKFAPVDAKTSSCFECPKGTYSDRNGADRCSACPLGKSTSDRGANSTQTCRYFCTAGKFSASGLEPCDECPRDTTQSRVGATYCESCFAGGITTGKTGTGFTNVFPWICMDSTGLQFGIEGRPEIIGRQIQVRVLWDIPEKFLDVGDIIAIFKGDAHDSIRQLVWMYASATDTTCTGWTDPGDSGCRQMGTNVVPRASTTFKFDSAGPGTYGVVFYSQRQQLRILTDTYVCLTEDELTGETSKFNFACPPDLGGWEARTGLKVCDKGKFSANGQFPCYDCEPGTVAGSFASTQCTECEQGYYSNEQCVAGQPCPVELQGLNSRERCVQCPAGKSTSQSKSVEQDCTLCEILWEETDEEVPFCARATEMIFNGTTPPLTTTPEPDFCGSGRVRYTEECDDGNLAPSDGCSEECTIEPRYKCMQEDADSPSHCFVACGDGQRESARGEECDDDNDVNSDGCDQNCKIENKWRCFGKEGELSICETLPVCGTGRREWEKGEICDDGNTDSGDGCSFECTIELNYVCTNITFTRPDICCATLALCGNGILDLCEDCDDANLVSGDGCSEECVMEDLSRCRDGCSGPLCQTEEGCQEMLIGADAQVIEKNDILRWFDIGDSVYMGTPTQRWPDGKLSFNKDITRTGNTRVSTSRGLILEGLRGPFFFNTLNLLAAKPDLWVPDLGFRGISGRAGLPTQLACTYCSGTRTLDWHEGTISEPLGMMVKDSECVFIITGAEPIGANPERRGVIIKVEEVNFQDDAELLVVSGAQAGYPSWNQEFRRGSATPVILHTIPPVQINFVGRSHLANRIVPWASPSGVRFKVSFHTLEIGDERGLNCAALCQNQPKCLEQDNCFVDGAIMNTEDDYLIFNNDDDRRRLPAFAAPLHPNFMQQPAEEGQSNFMSTRQALSDVDILTMAFEGMSDDHETIPCDFAQNKRQLVTQVQKQLDIWQGANGVWDGFCYTQASAVYCADESVQCEEGEKVGDANYFDEDNACQIRIEISDRTIREYRYDCNGGNGPDGLAYGVITDLGPAETVSSAVTGTTFIHFRRIELIWTRSTLLDDRPVGVAVKGFLTFGAQAEFDGNSRGLQIALAPPGAKLSDQPMTNENSGRFNMRAGACRRWDLTPLNRYVAVQEVDGSVLRNAGIVGDLRNLQQYVLCNSTFQQLQSLSKSSPECKHVLDAFLFRDVDSSIANIDKKVCSSRCFEVAKLALEFSANTCSKAWKQDQFTGIYTKLLYKKVYIVSTALFWSNVACLANHKEQQCTRPIFEYSELFASCPVFNTSTGPHGLLSAPFSVPASSVSPVCPAGCADALVEYQKVDGCCAATFAEAAATWASLLSVTDDKTSGDDKTRGLFRLNLGESANPWTPLGNDAGAKVYGPRHDCPTEPSAEWRGIYPQCLMTSPIFCDSPAWRPACCSFQCQNDGSKAETGDCYCSCPLDRVGAACNQQSAHARVEMIFPAEDRSTFHFGKITWLTESLAFLTEVLPELDSIQDLAGREGRRLQQSAPVGARVIVRLVTGSVREALRMADKSNDAILDGRLADAIASRSKNSWVPILQPGTYPALGLDSYGRELCDDIQTMCVLGREQQEAQAQNATVEVEQGNATLVTVTASLGSAAVALMLAAVFFFVCYKEGSVFWIFFANIKTTTNVTGMLPKSHDRVTKHAPDAKFQDDWGNAREKKSSVFFGESNRRAVALSLNPSGKKSGDNFSLSDDLFVSLAPSGNLYESLAASGIRSGDNNDPVNFAVSSDLVFDDALSAAPSAAVPTREETGNVHGKLIVQGKGNQIESPHVSKNGQLFGSARDPRRNKIEAQLRVGDGNMRRGSEATAKNVTFSHFSARSVTGSKAAPAPTGLIWVEAGFSRPKTGTEIKNVALAMALRHKSDFSQSEFERFHVEGLSKDSFVAVEGKYFRPVPGTLPSNTVSSIREQSSEMDQVSGPQSSGRSPRDSEGAEGSTAEQKRKELSQMIEHAVGRKQNYHYTPETVGIGVDEAQFQKTQILQRLKLIQKMRDQTSAFLHATTLSQPTLVSDPDAGYFNHDRKEEQWERLSVSKQSSSSAMYSGPFASVVSRPPLARPPSDPVRSAAAQASTSAGGIAISENPRSPAMAFDVTKNSIGLSLLDAASATRYGHEPAAKHAGASGGVGGSCSSSRPLPSGVPDDDASSVLGAILPSQPPNAAGAIRAAPSVGEEVS